MAPMMYMGYVRGNCTTGIHKNQGQYRKGGKAHIQHTFKNWLEYIEFMRVTLRA